LNYSRIRMALFYLLSRRIQNIIRHKSKSRTIVRLLLSHLN